MRGAHGLMAQPRLGVTAGALDLPHFQAVGLTPIYITALLRRTVLSVILDHRLAICECVVHALVD